MVWVCLFLVICLGLCMDDFLGGGVRFLVVLILLMLGFYEWFVVILCFGLLV